MIDRHDKKRATMARNIEEKTGRSVAAWAQFVVENGPASNKDRTAWLKSEHGLGHFQARMIVSAIDDK